ncbi:MAG TPA: phage terminase large subunit [Methanobacteriaceae archaeon]|nr:phage terminase large subunit [Methanobacteriaceae archaeon]
MNLTNQMKAVVTETIINNNYIPTTPFSKQLHFITNPESEALYGGQAGGGKSEALLMAGLQWVEDPDYNGLILRRTYKDLALPGALMDRAHEWLQPTDAHWNNTDKTWIFPSGATLSFGYLQHENDKYQYQSSEFQFIAFDELTQFTESQYLYLFSRLRRKENSQVPLRVRAGSNPGGLGHEWVKARFITGNLPFIPASYKENPYLDQSEYEKSLDKLDHITRQQLKYGNWDINPQGGLFKREWFPIITTPPATFKKRVRFWDLAATLPGKGRDPDYTVGLLLGVDSDNICYVLDVQRTRNTPLEVEKLILQTAQLDGKQTAIRMEQEGGATGKIVIDDYRRKLVGFNFRGEPAKKDKRERAKPVSSYAEAGNIRLLNRPWTSDLLDELESFQTEGIHDDQVDALSGAFSEISRPGGKRQVRSTLLHTGRRR